MTLTVKMALTCYQYVLIFSGWHAVISLNENRRGTISDGDTTGEQVIRTGWLGCLMSGEEDWNPYFTNDTLLMFNINSAFYN